MTDTDHGTAVLAAVAVVVSLLSWEQMSGAVPLRLGGVGPREALQGWAPGVSGCGLLITDSCINDNSRAFLITDSCIKDNSKAFLITDSCIKDNSKAFFNHGFLYERQF